jgi:hypothetical protein
VLAAGEGVLAVDDDEREPFDRRLILWLSSRVPFH